jgi:leucyl-tRNA synthetase
MSTNPIYDFKKIEEKWQKAWDEKKVFAVKEVKGKEKYYVLEMFPYPSGSGLHMGHAFNYTIGDINARFKRMSGFNVLYPMGYDSFGLPAENAAIKNKSHPQNFTDSAIANFISQQKGLGLSYDWSRMIKTSSPEYYKWNQFFFLELFKKGLIYRKESSVNWCRECDTVLANEQVHNGKCWRHSQVDVEVKQLEQWFIKITDYQDELLSGLDGLDWPERIKVMQRNWIGKSEGTLARFNLKNSDDFVEVFTTRIDTIFSVTFLVMAPDHPLALEFVRGTKRERDAKEFIRAMSRTTEKEDASKEGFFTGQYAINPANGKEIPIYLANFVLKDYGTGIVMADAHDSRDYEFAKKYNIPLISVLSPKDGSKWSEDRAFEDFGILHNSKQFNGLTSEKAIPKIREWLESKGLAKKTVNYKLRDWLVSRQRYWGTPIPMIYCDKCGIVPVPQKDLPVLLPADVQFGVGKGNPLASSKSFTVTTCPKCKGKARRETDTMDTFFDSSWYFLRYLDSNNHSEPFKKKIADYWMPVDTYIGGAEHACMHLIYSRFFTKALRDMGYIKIDEPFTKLFNQGMLHGTDGFVMSKSRGNVVLPEEISKRYGIDTARLFLMSIATPDKDTQWSEEGIEGSFKFVKRMIDLVSDYKIIKNNPDKKLDHYSNKAIIEITSDIQNFRYNLAIIKLREFFDKLSIDCDKSYFDVFVRLLSPFAPHLSEEFWLKLGVKGLVCSSDWPSADEKKINPEVEEAAKNNDQLVSDISNIVKIMKDKSGFVAKKVFVYAIPKDLGNYNIRDVSSRTQLEVSIFAVNDPKKYDPSGKAQKAKPGKPAIYIE